MDFKNLTQTIGEVLGRNIPVAETGRGEPDRAQAPVHKEYLDSAMDLAVAGQKRARQGLERAVTKDNREAADIYYEHLWQLRSLESALHSVPMLGTAGLPTYVMSALFLRRCHEELTFDKNEAMFYVSGVEQGGCICLTDIVEFEMKYRSTSGVHGDPESVFRAVLKLRQAGQSLFAWFHSHPGGRATCTPSATDMGMQRRLEDVGYPAVGGIFTRDGALRFFSADRRFRVQIHGKGVEHVDTEKFLYQIAL